jgi:flagellar biosynthesis chaperone FliJ
VAGPVGSPVTGNEILEIVERQIDDLHRELDVQMKRVAQIQQQMDELRETVRRLVYSDIPSR